MKKQITKGDLCRSTVWSLSAIATLVAFPSVLFAEEIRIRVEGTIASESSCTPVPCDTVFSVGDTFVFETTLDGSVLGELSSPTYGRWQETASFSLVDIAGMRLEETGTGRDESTAVSSPSFRDAFWSGTTVAVDLYGDGSVNQAYAEWECNAAGSAWYPSGSIPTLLSDAIGDLSLSIQCWFWIYDEDPPYGSVASDNAVATRLPATPEKVVEELVEMIVQINIDNKVSNALDAKLTGALEALDDSNVKNDGAALNALQAVLNSVEAQRGKKISDEDADAIVAATQAAIDAINQLSSN